MNWHLSNTLKNKTDPAFSDQDTVQVLSLDGGGLRGLFSASVIKSFESQLGHSICEHFDIITGTSTGGLIALALGLGKTGEEIQRFYLSHGNEIFPCGFFKDRWQWARWFVVSKYSNNNLKKTLKCLLTSNDAQEPLFGDSKKRLIIPTYLTEESIPRLLKTPHAARYKNDWKLPMWVVGMATSAAPTYLPSFTYGDKTYLDGGLWSNNPSLVGLVEAKDLGARLDKIRVLNIGTTYTSDSRTHCYPFSKKRRRLRFRRGGLLSWSKQLVLTVMDANSYATSQMYLHQFLEPGNSVSINTQLNVGDCDLDKVDTKRLVSLGSTTGEHTFPQVQTFFEHRAPQYTPNEEAISSGR